MYFPRGSVFAVLPALAVGCVGAPAGSYIIHEHAADSTDEWAKVGHVYKDGLLPVRIGLTQNNLDQAEDLLMEV
jgi:tripeptidyl-peptidase I